MGRRWPWPPEWGSFATGWWSGAPTCSVAVGGEYGTLSEVAFALKLGRPVVGLQGWRLQRPDGTEDTGVIRASTPAEAVELALTSATGAPPGLADRSGSRTVLADMTGLASLTGPWPIWSPLVDDAIVIGSGPNGLVAANLLADAGWSVTVLEAAPEPGGAVRSGELTLAGFRHDLFSAFYPLAVASPALADLRLEEYGLRWRHSPVVLAHPLPDGRCVALSRDLEVTARSVDRFAPGDGAAWKAMMSHWEKIAGPFIKAILGPFPPAVAASRVGARLGVLDTLRLLRHLVLPVRRMTEELFEGEGAALLLGGSALHTDLSPEAAGSGLYGWLLSCVGQQYGFPVPHGGSGELTASLIRRLAARGGSVRCGARAVEVVVRNRRAVAVRTADGDCLGAARAVVADVSAPVLYRALVDPDLLPQSVLDDVGRFHWDMATVKVDWALDGPVPWHAPKARQAATVHVADDFDNLTEFAAHLAMGRLPARPFLVFGQPAMADPTRSPPGTGTAWAYTHVPHRVRGDAAGTLDVDRGEASWLEGFVDRMEARVEALASGFRASIRGRHVFSPSGT